jgi:hypothetical protein
MSTRAAADVGGAGAVGGGVGSGASASVASGAGSLEGVGAVAEGAEGVESTGAIGVATSVTLGGRRDVGVFGEAPAHATSAEPMSTQAALRSPPRHARGMVRMLIFPLAVRGQEGSGRPESRAVVRSPGSGRWFASQRSLA